MVCVSYICVHIRRRGRGSVARLYTFALGARVETTLSWLNSLTRYPTLTFPAFPLSLPLFSLFSSRFVPLLLRAFTDYNYLTNYSYSRVFKPFLFPSPLIKFAGSFLISTTFKLLIKKVILISPKINYPASIGDVSRCIAQPVLPSRYLVAVAIFLPRDFESLAHWIKEMHAPRSPRRRRWNLGTKAARMLSRLMLIRLGFTLDFDER